MTGPGHHPSWWLLRHLSRSGAPADSWLLKSNFAADTVFFSFPCNLLRQLYFFLQKRSCYCSSELSQDKSTSPFEWYLKIALLMYQRLHYQVWGVFWCEDGSYRLNIDQQVAEICFVEQIYCFKNPEKNRKLLASHKTKFNAVSLHCLGVRFSLSRKVFRVRSCVWPALQARQDISLVLLWSGCSRGVSSSAWPAAESLLWGLVVRCLKLIVSYVV